MKNICNMAKSNILAASLGLMICNWVFALPASSCLSILCGLPLEYSQFVQETDKFWAYDRISRSWKGADISQIFDNQDAAGVVESNVENSVSKVSPTDTPNVQNSTSKYSATDIPSHAAASSSIALRKRLSLVRVSEVSIWVTGESGSIYERFWNGLQWVIIPHDLPSTAGYASGILCVNRTMVALSEEGMLYQLQLDENRHPFWLHCGPWLPATSYNGRAGSTLLRPGEASADGRSLYFATSDGSLAELLELHPLRWVNHGRPRGGNVTAVADAGILRPSIIFTISKNGDLYEFDPKARPTWKKHVREGSIMENSSLMPIRGVSLHGLMGASCLSLFHLTTDGFLVERRFHQRKWHWIIHSSPVGFHFSAVGPISVNESSTDKVTSIFLTTRDGDVFEYRFSRYSGTNDSTMGKGLWINHKHPSNAPVARSLAGEILVQGRVMYALDDGRFGELHFPGLGGERVGPILHSISGKRLQTSLSTEYQWSLLDSPESEGGNAGYCTLTRGPSHCVEGIKENPIWGSESKIPQLILKRANGKGRIRQTGATADKLIRDDKFISSSSHRAPWNNQNNNLFHMRTVQIGKSFFLVGNDENVFERVYNAGMWLWLKHEHLLPVKGILGTYNGSVFVVDVDGIVLMREHVGDTFHWINCSAAEGGQIVMSGPPWDGVLGQIRMVTAEDAVFFVNSNGSLIELIVALHRFSWKDCGHPSTAYVSFILDQEVLRYRVVFVVGSDGQLYHFNRVTQNWHAHSQPVHIVLSRIPGTVIRPTYESMVGSLFMRSEDGELVEFHWDNSDGWTWIDHGAPESGIALATSPGPSLGSWRLFVIASNGHVFSRYFVGNQWIWVDHKYPSAEFPLLDPPFSGQHSHGEAQQDEMANIDEDEHEIEDSIPFSHSNFNVQGMDLYMSLDGECDMKVAPVRPIAFSKRSIIFMLNDGRLAELKQWKEDAWNWSHIVNTPTSSCQVNYWTATAS